MMSTEILRRFNRTYTRRIGALDESFLGLGMPLREARLLYEIGVAAAPTVRELRDRLDLDSGYLSRLLRALEGRELVEVRHDPADRRRRIVILTAAGRDAHRELDDRSEARARSLLEPLTPRQRERLTTALATAELLVRAATLELLEVDGSHPLARQAVASYVAELVERLPSGFDAAPDPGRDDPVCLVAVSDGQPVGCGALQQLDREVAEVKRLWVHPDWRGAGLGARLLAGLETAAARRGHTRVVLDTSSELHEAVGLYESSGYRSVERYNDNPHATTWYAKDVSEDR